MRLDHSGAQQATERSRSDHQEQRRLAHPANHHLAHRQEMEVFRVPNTDATIPGHGRLSARLSPHDDSRTDQTADGSGIAVLGTHTHTHTKHSLARTATNRKQPISCAVSDIRSSSAVPCSKVAKN